MLVDQDDTPLFLGAIHRVLAGVTSTTLAPPRPPALATTSAPTPGRRRRGARPRARSSLTDGTRWATLGSTSATGRAAVEVLHERAAPGARQARRAGSAYHHSVEDTLADLPRQGAVAVLMPAPTSTWCCRTVAGDRLLPEKATSFQPKPSLGVLIRLAARRMSRPRLTSTSTRDAAPPAARKNRRRTAPDTSTTSSAAQVGHRAPGAAAPHRAVERVDLLTRPTTPVGGTTTRNVQTVSPLGSSRSSGCREIRPTRRTSLTALRSRSLLLC